MRPILFLWRVTVFTSVYLFAFYTFLWGQATTVTVDIAKAALTWQWTQGTGGPVEKWLIRCGPSSTNYNILVTLPTPAARSIPIAQVTSDVGTYYCIVSASNSFGTSGPSNEVSYSAGKAPVSPTALAIQAQ